MTLEQQYIEKFNFDCKGFSENIKFFIFKDKFLYYIQVIYTSPSNPYDTISLKLFNFNQIHIESKIKEFNKDYYTIFPIMLNIINTFTDFLNKNPLILIDYQKEKEIQELKEFKENKTAQFNVHKLYNLLINKDTDHSLFLKNMKYNKQYPIKLIELYISSYQYIDFYEHNFKIQYKDGIYFLFFTNKYSISLSFEQALTLLSYFSMEDKFGIFNTLGKKLKQTSILNVISKNCFNLKIEQFLLNLEMQNF